MIKKIFDRIFTVIMILVDMYFIAMMFASAEMVMSYVSSDWFGRIATITIAAVFTNSIFIGIKHLIKNF